jgi:hypothetical protein
MSRVPIGKARLGQLARISDVRKRESVAEARKGTISNASEARSLRLSEVESTP